jgi:hypothetical protein
VCMISIDGSVGQDSSRLRNQATSSTTSQLVRAIFQSIMGSHEGAFSAEPAAGDHPKKPGKPPRGENQGVYNAGCPPFQEAMHAKK